MSRLSELELAERSQKKISENLIKLHVFLGFEPFLLSKSEFEIHNFLVNNLVTHKTNLEAEFDLKSSSIPSR